MSNEKKGGGKGGFLDLDELGTTSQPARPGSSEGRTVTTVSPTVQMLGGTGRGPIRKMLTLTEAQSRIRELEARLENGAGGEDAARELAEVRAELDEARARERIVLKMPVTALDVEFEKAWIDPSLIDVSPQNQRMQNLLDDAAVADILEDIARSGQTEPGILRPTGNGRYEAIAGSRRLHCVRRIRDTGRDPARKYLALIGQVPDADVRRLSRIENQQSQISPYELACSYARDIENKVYSSWNQLAAAEGISAAYAQRYKDLAGLPQAIVKAFAKPADLTLTIVDWLMPKLARGKEEDRKALLDCASQLQEEKSRRLAAHEEPLQATEVAARLKSAVRKQPAQELTAKKPIIIKKRLAGGMLEYKHSIARSDGSRKFEVKGASDSDLQAIDNFIRDKLGLKDGSP